MAVALTTIRRQFARYAVIGLVSNLTLYSVYLLLTIYFLQPRTAMTITYAIGVLVTFLLNRSWTFAFSGRRRAALARYLLVYTIGYIINLLVLSIFVNAYGYPHEVVQAGMILFLAIAIFLAQKLWVFGPRIEE